MGKLIQGDIKGKLSMGYQALTAMPRFLDEAKFLVVLTQKLILQCPLSAPFFKGFEAFSIVSQSAKQEASKIPYMDCSIELSKIQLLVKASVY